MKQEFLNQDLSNIQIPFLEMYEKIVHIYEDNAFFAYSKITFQKIVMQKIIVLI